MINFKCKIHMIFAEPVYISVGRTTDNTIQAQQPGCELEYTRWVKLLNNRDNVNVGYGYRGIEFNLITNEISIYLDDTQEGYIQVKCIRIIIFCGQKNRKYRTAQAQVDQNEIQKTLTDETTRGFLLNLCELELEFAAGPFTKILRRARRILTTRIIEPCGTACILTGVVPLDANIIRACVVVSAGICTRPTGTGITGLLSIAKQAVAAAGRGSGLFVYLLITVIIRVVANLDSPCVNIRIRIVTVPCWVHAKPACRTPVAVSIVVHTYLFIMKKKNLYARKCSQVFKSTDTTPIRIGGICFRGWVTVCQKVGEACPVTINPQTSQEKYPTKKEDSCQYGLGFSSAHGLSLIFKMLSVHLFIAFGDPCITHN